MGPIAGILLSMVASKMQGGTAAQGIGRGLSQEIDPYGQRAAEREQKRQALKARIGQTAQGGIVRQNPYPEQTRRQVSLPQQDGGLQPYASAPIGGRYRF